MSTPGAAISPPYVNDEGYEDEFPSLGSPMPNPRKGKGVEIIHRAEPAQPAQSPVESKRGITVSIGNVDDDNNSEDGSGQTDHKLAVAFMLTPRASDLKVVVQPCTCPVCLMMNAADTGSVSDDEDDYLEDMFSPNTEKGYEYAEQVWQKSVNQKSLSRSKGSKAPRVKKQKAPGMYYNQDLGRLVKTNARMNANRLRARTEKRSRIISNRMTKEYIPPPRPTYYRPPPSRQLGRADPTTSAYTDILAAELGLDAATARLLVELQHREINENDYNLLLELDESVAPTTLDSHTLELFPTLVVGTDITLEEDDVCMVCLEGYPAGDVVRQLPCGHVYHRNCIDEWLSAASNTCPTDGLPLDDSHTHDHDDHDDHDTAVVDGGDDVAVEAPVPAAGTTDAEVEVVGEWDGGERGEWDAGEGGEWAHRPQDGNGDWVAQDANGDWVAVSAAPDAVTA